MVFLIKEMLPSAIPYPNSIGPSPNPWRGFSWKSISPVEIFLNKPTGLPIISIYPISAKRFFISENL